MADIVNKPVNKIDVETLRFVPIDVLDKMIQHIYNANKEVIDLYFELLKTKEINKIQSKPVDTTIENIKENDKLERGGDEVIT